MDQHQKTTYPPPTQQNWEKKFKARVLTSDEWGKQRHNITEIYLKDGHSLPQLRKIMAEEHDFYANETQYKRRIKEWGLGKNLNKKATLALLEIQRSREMEGKSTTFNYKGRLVRGDKLERSRKRLGDHNYFTTDGLDSSKGEPSEPVVTPVYVEYFTPGSTSDDTESTGRIALQSIKGVEASSEIAYTDSEDTMMEDVQEPESSQELNDLLVASPDVEYSTQTLRTGGTGVSNEISSQSSGGAAGTDNITSRGGGCVAMKDTIPHLRPALRGSSSIRGLPLNTPRSQAEAALGVNLGNSRFVTGFSGKSDDPIEVRSSDDGKKFSPASALWIGWGSAKSIFGSWIRNDVIMSGMSPFRTPRSVSHHSAHEYLANCCGNMFHTKSEMINHYENYHIQQNHDHTIHQASNDAANIVASSSIAIVASAPLARGVYPPVRDYTSLKPMNTVLHNAAVGDRGLIHSLPRKGVDQSDLWGIQKALEEEAKNVHEAITFMKAVDLLDFWGPSGALIEAAKNGHEAVIRLLLGQDTNRLDTYWISETVEEWVNEAVKEAAKNGDEAVVHLLLEQAAIPLNSLWKSKAVKEALKEAAKNGHEAAVRLLLEKVVGGWWMSEGARRTARQAVKEAVKEVAKEAAKNGHEVVVRLVLEKAANSLDSSTVPVAVNEATNNGYEAVVCLLLEKATHPLDSKLMSGAVREAANNGHDAVVRLLLERGTTSTLVI